MSKVTSLVKQVSGLTPEVSKKVAAMVGAVVGDAASIHLQWIYDQRKLSKIVSKGENPEFWPEDHNSYFTLPNGKYSCYADEAVQTLNVMAENDNCFDEKKVLDHYCEYFGGPKSPYQIALAQRDPRTIHTGVPIEGPWIQGTLVKMMKRVKENIYPPGPKDTDEHDGLEVVLPYVIQQAPNLDFDQLKKGILLTAWDPNCVNHHLAESYLISEFIKDVHDPVESTREKFHNNKLLDDVIYKELTVVQQGVASGMDPKELVRRLGMACHLPGSFLSSVVSIIDAKSFASAIRQNILCGGDCCSRATVIGACLGAKFGIEGIPIEWIDRVEGIEDLIAKSIKVFS